MTVRRIFLVRHGQYDEEGTGALTELGRRQAALTAEVLRSFSMQSITASKLLRARETAAIVSNAFPTVRVRESKLIIECVPTKIPRVPGIDATTVARGRAQAEAAFSKFFVSSKAKRTDLLVCHGNIIRFFVAKALGVAPKVWTAMQSYHCGITTVLVLPGGKLRLAGYNETMHLPREMRTMSLKAVAMR